MSSELDSVVAGEAATGPHPTNWPTLVGWVLWGLVLIPAGVGFILLPVVAVASLPLAGFGLRRRYSGRSRLAAGFLGALGVIACLVIPVFLYALNRSLSEL